MQQLPRIDYANHPAYGGMLTANDALAASMLEQLRPIVDEMAAVEAERQARFGYRYGADNGLAGKLAAEGAGKAWLPSAEVDAIEASVQPVIDEILTGLGAARGAGEPIRYRDAHRPLSQPDHPKLWAQLDRGFETTGVFAATRTLFHAPGAKLKSVAALVNQPKQAWTDKLFRDLDDPSPPTAGFHIDSNGKCFVKSVIYLRDVGPNQGPFGVVPQSHLWDEGSRDRILRRAFDRSPFITRSAKWRSGFLALPPEYQVKAEFGGDMIAGSPEAERLLAAEDVCIGPRGQVNLFNPETIHRGGATREGERRALLVTVAPCW